MLSFCMSKFALLCCELYESNPESTYLSMPHLTNPRACCASFFSSQQRPYWLQTYSKIIKNQQSSPIYQELLATLKPWESEKVESIAQAEALDERWTAFRGRYVCFRTHGAHPSWISLQIYESLRPLRNNTSSCVLIC